jgi:hypothetical protein
MNPSVWTQMPWTWALLAAALWIGFSLAISMLGWSQAAEAYACEGFFPDLRFRFQSAGFRRGAGYNRGVTFGVDDEALYLRMALPFRIGHPPLRIPWSDITPRSVRAGWVDRVDLELAAAPKATLRITPQLGERLARAAGRRWPAGGALAGGA